MDTNLKSSEFRLLIAVCLVVVLFVASPTSPTDAQGCSGDNFHGDLLVVNNSKDASIEISFTGPTSSSLYNIMPGHSQTKTGLKHGMYTYRITATRSKKIAEATWTTVKSVKVGSFKIFEGKGTQVDYP